MPAEARLAFRGPSQLFPTGPTPTSVAIADLDRDGNTDLVVTNSAVYSASRISSISILRGNGDGTFEPKRDIIVGHVPQAVVVADLNRDGHLDLAIANYGEYPDFGATISILPGRGDGTFAPATDYAAGAELRNLDVADLNGDGDLDLVTEGSVLLGNGDGTFRPRQAFGTWRDWFAAVADLDGDGHPDIVTSNLYADPDDQEGGSEAFAVRLGNGDGTFRAPIRQGIGATCWGLTIADLNADGHPDLAICNLGTDSRSWSGISVYLGNGDGSFGTGRFLPTGRNPISVAVADINGDDLLDLATANFGSDPDWDSNSATILLGNGDGTFRRGSELQAGDNPVHVAIGRLDGNGTPDLVTVNQMSNTLSVFTGNGDGTFGVPDQNPGRPPRSLAAADLDRDGRMDLAFTFYGPWPEPGGASVLLGRGDGSFGQRLDLPIRGNLGYVNAADLNGDLAPDLVMPNESTNVLSLMLGIGDGTFRTPTEIPLGTWPGQTTISDLNRDGRADLVFPLGYSAVSVLLGNGDGSFGAGVRFATGPNARSVGVGDLDRDGSLDLAVSLVGHSVSVLLGHGDGSFGTHTLNPSGELFANRAEVALGDLNEDGKLDAVVGDRILLGNGDGTFRSGIPLFGRPGPEHAVIADLDGDRHQDLAFLFGKEVASFVSIYRGNGDGTFGQRLDFGVGHYSTSLVLADFDHDGRPDLAVASSGTISVLLNRSVAPLGVRFTLDPAVVNPGSQGRWVTGSIELAPPHSARDIDVASIRLNGVLAVDPSAPTSVRNNGRNGAGGLTVRFDRAALAAALPAGEHVPVTIAGTLGIDEFTGSTKVRVLAQGSPISQDLESSAGSQEPELALRLASPVRAEAGRLRFRITLSDDGPARVDLLDIAGRVISARSLASLAAGAHEIDLTASRTLAPGVYFVRLRQGAREVRAKAAVVQ